MDKPLPPRAATGTGAPVPDKPWAVTAAKVEAAVERIAAAVHPARILAFGSRARGEAGPESDLDLLIVLPEGRTEAGVSGTIQGLLKGLLLCADVLVVEAGRFERLRGALNTLYRAVDWEGVELYADGAARRDAVAKISR
jgi:uncharacterized protein